MRGNEEKPLKEDLTLLSTIFSSLFIDLKEGDCVLFLLCCIPDISLNVLNLFVCKRRTLLDRLNSRLIRLDKSEGAMDVIKVTKGVPIVADGSR